MGKSLKDMVDKKLDAVDVAREALDNLYEELVSDYDYLDALEKIANYLRGKPEEKAKFLEFLDLVEKHYAISKVDIESKSGDYLCIVKNALGEEDKK